MGYMTHTRLPQSTSRPLSARERAKARAVAKATRDVVIEFVSLHASIYRESGMTSSALALERFCEIIEQDLDLDDLVSHL